ncbi:hypothetical protein EIP91_006837 [Steccherinum ochraceum]|uniref:Uncharacterized protein n=1 Tax=Steccherinum ochraceum TaxID=92696 RepID=A0A4V2MVH4_9APHY|nr:hypothetical protein EIP91_006837 [Steccherinum ochraceum]
MHLSPTLGLLSLAFIVTSSVSAAPVDVAARRISSHQSLDRRALLPNADSLVRRQASPNVNEFFTDPPGSDPEPEKKKHWWQFWARDDAELDDGADGVDGPSDGLVKRQASPNVNEFFTDPPGSDPEPEKKKHWWQFWARDDAGLDGGVDEVHGPSDGLVRRAVTSQPQPTATGPPAKGPWRQLSRRDEEDEEDGDAGEDGDDGEDFS